jgi:hypothetical protein
MGELPVGRDWLRGMGVTVPVTGGVGNNQASPLCWPLVSSKVGGRWGGCFLWGIHWASIVCDTSYEISCAQLYPPPTHKRALCSSCSERVVSQFVIFLSPHSVEKEALCVCMCVHLLCTYGVVVVGWVEPCLLLCTHS